MDADQNCLVEFVEQQGVTDVVELMEDSVTTIEISMRAFSGSFNPRKIRLMGWVQGQTLSVLVDSGSTHYFIQEAVVERLGFTVEALPVFKVFIDNREYLVCKEVCRQVDISIQNTIISEDLFVLSMGGANIVLNI